MLCYTFCAERDPCYTLSEEKFFRKAKQCNSKVLNIMAMIMVRGENVWKYVLEVHRRYICSVSLQLLTLHTCPVLLFIGPKSLVLLCQSLGHWVSDAFEFLSWTHAAFPSLFLLAVSFKELIELKEVNVAFIAEIYFDSWYKMSNKLSPAEFVKVVQCNSRLCLC